MPDYLRVSGLGRELPMRLGFDFGPVIVSRDSYADRRAKRKDREVTVWDDPSTHPIALLVLLALFVAAVVSAVLFLIKIVVAIWPVLVGLTVLALACMAWPIVPRGMAPRSRVATEPKT